MDHSHRERRSSGELGMFEDLAIKLAHDLHNLILSDAVSRNSRPRPFADVLNATRL